MASLIRKTIAESNQQACLHQHPECRTAINIFLLQVFSIFGSLLLQQIFYDLQKTASTPVRIRNNTYPNNAAVIPFSFKLNTKWNNAATSKLPASYLRKKEQSVRSAEYRKLDGKEEKRVTRVCKKTEPGCPELNQSHNGTSVSWNTLCNVKQN